jgi:hypothetical protein
MANLLNNHYYTLQKKRVVGYRPSCFWPVFISLGIVIGMQSKEKSDVTLVFHSTTSFTDPGRISETFCERDVITKLMKSAEKTIVQHAQSTTIIPLVKAGHRDPIDAAQLINHIRPDVCFIFSAYKTESSIPECGVYWYSWSSMVSCIKKDDLVFVKEADAYRISYDITIKYAERLQKELHSSMKHWGQVSCAAFPIMMLRGIIVPAFLIEIGLPDESMADSYGTLIGTIISTIV